MPSPYFMLNVWVTDIFNDVHSFGFDFVKTLSSRFGDDEKIYRVRSKFFMVLLTCQQLGELLAV